MVEVRTRPLEYQVVEVRQALEEQVVGGLIAPKPGALGVRGVPGIGGGEEAEEHW